MEDLERGARHEARSVAGDNPTTVFQLQLALSQYQAGRTCWRRLRDRLHNRLCDGLRFDRCRRGQVRRRIGRIIHSATKCFGIFLLLAIGIRLRSGVRAAAEAVSRGDSNLRRRVCGKAAVGGDIRATLGCYHTTSASCTADHEQCIGDTAEHSTPPLLVVRLLRHLGVGVANRFGAVFLHRLACTAGLGILRFDGVALSLAG
mmetsp:Transcript_74493/g.216005  ORF Transcript_74493/g.216005 Transcript_74493/m.216005 type:complete len:203 (+) Transcript_74493:2026-2634(+)